MLENSVFLESVCGAILGYNVYLRTMKLNIHATKIELIQWLSTIDNPKVLEKIIAIRESEKEDWWLQLSEHEQQSIDRGIEDAEAKKLRPHSDAREIYGKWL